MIGTYSLRDLQTNQDLARLSVPDFGVDNLMATIRRDNAAAAALLDAQLALFAEKTTDQARRAGTDSGFDSYELDETGRAPTQKSTGSYEVAFPLRKFGTAVGWTASALKRATVADIARQTLAAQLAYKKSLVKGLQTAFYTPTNSTFRDVFAANITLNIKALANNDGTDYGLDINGNAIGTSHSHYLANSTLTAAAVTGLINTVLEHESGQVVIDISALDAGAWTALTGFVPAQNPLVITPNNTVTSTLALDIQKTDNRVIGTIGGAIVYTRSWAKSGYAIARIQGSNSKPLAMRVSDRADEQGLFLAGTNMAYPLQADQWEWYAGFGGNNRLAAAVLDYGHGSYTTPTL